MPLNVGIIDPSIVTQGTRESKIDLATPVNMYTALRADSRAQKLSELTLSKEEKAAKREEDLQGIIKSSLTPDGHIDSEKALASLNRGGFVDEAAHIQERMEKARMAQQTAMQEAQKAKQEMQKRAGNAALAVLDSKGDKAESFLQFQKYAQENNLPISEDVKNYRLSDEEGHTGQLHPKIMSYLDYLGNESLSPEQRLARQKATDPNATPEEYGMAPIYGKDAAGNTVALQTKKSGGIKKIELPEGITLTPGVTHIDMGDKTGLVDKSGKVVATIDKGIDPGKKADLGIKGEELVLKKEEATQKAAKAEADKIEVAKKARAYALKNQAGLESIQTFLDKANKVKDNPNMKFVTGAGSVGSYVPGTGAADLQADIDFLVSSGAIETLGQLKSQSATGASGMGALSDAELVLLKNSFSSLGNKNISPNKKREELSRIIGIMDKRLREQRELTRESNSLLGPEPTEAETRKARMKNL